ncbi:MAG: orotate phosphoribosyltransferase [Methanomassiliicoccales archaeon]|jgi:orotate phosphoribosyltransferase|nr:orotate phosphoribosyltransferase [Methanomassiliicoccales archaeon]
MSKMRIKEALSECGALMYGDFTLASGKRSKYYIDIKKASTDPQVLAEIAEEMACTMVAKGLVVDRIAGVVLGSIPLAVALSLRTGTPFVMVRKERKDHGTGKLIEGAMMQNDRILVVEDVVTSAGSSSEAISILRSAGAKVTTVLTVIDRQEGGKERLAETGVELLALLTAEDVLRD